MYTMNRLDIILHELANFHHERAARENERYVKMYPRYLNVVREIPPSLAKKAETVVSHETVAAKFSDDDIIRQLQNDPELQKLLADEKIDNPQKLFALIKFMYTALSGICYREGKLVESCKRHSLKSTELVNTIRKKIAEIKN